MRTQTHAESSATEMATAPTGPARLAIAWQHPNSRLIEAVGLLAWDGETYGFRYLRRAKSVLDFRPLLSFPDLHQTYESSQLFPLFAQRIMSKDRPDYSRYLQSLDLESTAQPWAILGRSEGQRAGDFILAFPEPLRHGDGTSSTRFWVHGIRHRLKEDPQVGAILGELQDGDQLQLVLEPDNPANERAILVADAFQVGLGYVPDLLLDYIHHLRSNGEVTTTVAHVNSADAPPNLRLLVEVRGTTEPNYTAFAGSQWEAF